MPARRQPSAGTASTRKRACCRTRVGAGGWLTSKRWAAGARPSVVVRAWVVWRARACGVPRRRVI
eukprot:12753585-Alexandrium_andersonii.AAC.1